MRFCSFAALALVHIYVLICIDGERAIRVDRNQEEAGIRIDQIGLISHMQIVDHRGLVQVRQLGHIIRFVELRRVDLIDAFGIYFPLLVPELAAAG